MVDDHRDDRRSDKQNRAAHLFEGWTQSLDDAGVGARVGAGDK